MALMRYGFIDHGGTGLHDIWGLHSTTAEAWLSLGVVIAFTAVQRCCGAPLHARGGEMRWPGGGRMKACCTPALARGSCSCSCRR